MKRRNPEGCTCATLSTQARVERIVRRISSDDYFYTDFERFYIEFLDREFSCRLHSPDVQGVHPDGWDAADWGDYRDNL
jgi:hypothetical protein